MPRFYFHLDDGNLTPDVEGIELPDLASARAYATRFLGELLQGEADRFWVGGQWTLTVSDASGLSLFSLYCGAIDAPAVQPPLTVIVQD